MEIAEIELDEAIQYYNYEVAGLGDDFLTEVLDTLDRIARFPEAWHPCSKRTRRCQMRRFPYGIIYQIRKAEILVIAVENLHREPNCWEDRL
ncbi:type II toxin-antitoxin system RelE/ParE family toxin [Desulforhabdus sp. TSK]|uniref:type II toxin-antitoxin system RelE/ParE family toxin n=1 Tax=Desulforhabdus sp. TSK TaxID=2925014 RepID=UPI001FC87598|nr:type II toxin-antitoxin system RelE/ParE family toxin [Desulforhabdus sp. TSK]